MSFTQQGLPAFPFADSSPYHPSESFARLRADQPVARVGLADGSTAWLVTRHRDVRVVLTDPRFSRAEASRPGAPGCDLFLQVAPTSILALDPPEHTRLRRLVAGAFTSRRVERLRPRVQEIVDGLLDELAARQPPADLVEGLALPLPITVICELLGVPTADQPSFRVWSDQTVSIGNEVVRARTEAVKQSQAYFAELIERRRHDPGDDLLSALVAARDEQGRLSEGELVNLAITLLVAGHETTVSQIANFTLYLLRHPDQLRRLRAEPGLVASAVEELLRYVQLETTGGAMIRVATADVELGGITIRAGEAVIPATSSANRDETVFDDPDRLDIVRAENPHIIFGAGAHHCLGANLARMELQVTLGAMLPRFPNLRLAVPEGDLRWKPSLFLHSLVSLPVTW